MCVLIAIPNVMVAVWSKVQPMNLMHKMQMGLRAHHRIFIWDSISQMLHIYTYRHPYTYTYIHTPVYVAFGRWTYVSVKCSTCREQLCLNLLQISWLAKFVWLVSRLIRARTLVTPREVFRQLACPSRAATSVLALKGGETNETTFSASL